MAKNVTVPRSIQAWKQSRKTYLQAPVLDADPIAIEKSFTSG
jgi:hypothetical protein